MNTPKISVVIPVYNGEKYLAQTLDSLLRQSFRDFEILCINDCSQDNTESILKHYAQTDPRVRVLATDVNQGIVPKVLKNYALPNLKGEYYVYSSCDDLFSEDWLDNMWRKVEETNADAVVPDLVFFHEKNRAMDWAIVGLAGDRNVVLSNREAVIQSLDCNISPCALWRVSLVKSLGFADFAINADEYSARVFFLHCNKVVFSDGIFYYRQDNPEAITKKPSYKWFDGPCMHFKLFELLVDNQFASEWYTKELMKAFHGVIRKKQELILNKANFSTAHRQEAERRILHCYETITRCELAVRIIKQQHGLMNALASFSGLHGYRCFHLTCVLAAHLRLLRLWRFVRSATS